MQSYCTLLIIISSDTSSMLAEQPRPAGAAPSPLSYRPHKMERYYAEHILQTHFGHSSDGGCGGGEGEQPGLHVHGRDAVPFLTTSGMDRNVLRCIWSVVDPGGIGTLLDMSQVHAMLRLVALGQAGLLPPGAPPDREAYAGALAMYSHQVVTLPTFSAIGDVPSAAFLISNYAPAVSGDNGGSSVGEAAAFDQNFQYRLWQQQEQQKMLARSLGVAESASEMSMDSPGMGGSAPAMSIGDAFADLGPSEDRALPSEDFRDFAEASDEDEDEVHGNAIASIDEEAAVITTDRSGDDDGEKTVGFGSFNDGGTAAIGMEDQAPPSDPPPPVPPQEPSSLKAEVDQVPMDQREHQSWDIEQVGADTILAHASAMQPQVTKEAQFPTSDDPFAVMGAMEDAPLPPLPSAGPPAPPAEVDDDEDGDEGDDDEEEGDDDEDGDEGDDDEDDDFGNFEEVKAVGAEIDNNLSSVEEVPTASKGGSELVTEDLKGDLFASSQGVLVAPSDDPFAVMGAMEDAPLPPLPSAGPPAPPAEVDVAEDGDEDGDEGDDDEDDDFGNFEEVTDQACSGASFCGGDNDVDHCSFSPFVTKGGEGGALEAMSGNNQTEPLTAEGPLESQRTMDNKSFDFGDFCEEIKPSTSETADGIRLEAIRSEMLLSTSLPGAFCDINVLDYFDESMKSGENVGRAIRCLFVFRALSSACNLGTVWGKLVAAAHNEVGSGRELLNMLRTGEVPISETSESEKIGPYLQSLCECVRVSRCIIASLADLLCLDSEVNIRGSDQWPSLKIVRDSADIEDFWDDIQSISKELDISVDLSLSTIPVIRRRSPSGQEQSSKVCSLTLQSFELFGREPEATASVNWHNHTYMACAANLWANRVSINAPQ